MIIKYVKNADGWIWATKYSCKLAMWLHWSFTKGLGKSIEEAREDLFIEIKKNEGKDEVIKIEII